MQWLLVLKAKNQTTFSKNILRGLGMSEELNQEQRKAKVLELICEAEKLAYEYFCKCEIGEERIRAGQVYNNIRNAMRV